MPIPALTLKQPYATLVADGIKTVETRSWKPPANVVGRRLAIHAAKTTAPVELKPGLQKVMNERYPFAWPHELPPTGAVVATARLKSVSVVAETGPDDEWFRAVDAHSRKTEKFANDDLGDYSVGKHLWFLDDVIKLEDPPKIRGYQGVWTLFWNKVDDWNLPRMQTCPECRAPLNKSPHHIRCEKPECGFNYFI